MSDPKPTLSERREAERRKYRLIYDAHPRYGTRDHWRPGASWIKALRIRSVLDVGTGRSTFPGWMFDANRAHHVYATDPALESDSLHGWQLNRTAKHPYRQLWYGTHPAHALALPANCVEYVTAFDVLEHLLPEEVEVCLREMARVANRGMIFTIATRPSARWPVGKETFQLHPTVEPLEWWQRLIRRATGATVRQIEGFTFCSLCASAEHDHANLANPRNTLQIQ